MRRLLFAVALSVIVVPATASSQPRRCNLRIAEPIYRKFAETRMTDTTSALMLAREYLRACNDSSVSLTREAQSYITAVERAASTDRGTQRSRLSDLIHIHGRFAEAYELGRQLLAGDSTDLEVLVTLGYGGFVAMEAQERSFDSAATAAARQAIALIEGGQSRPTWTPFASRDETLAWLHFTAGSLLLERDPLAAARHFHATSTLESSLRSEPTLYYALASAYERAVYHPLYQSYTTTFGGKPVSAESRLAKAQIDTVMDRLIEIYARAIAHEKPDSPQRATAMQRAVAYYRARHGAAAAGLDSIIARARSEPLAPIQP